MSDKEKHEIALEIAKLYIQLEPEAYRNNDDQSDNLIRDFINVYKDAINKLENN